MRRLNSVFIALGGNLGNVEENFRKALTILSGSIKIEAVSALYLSRPQVDIALPTMRLPPDFLNAALAGKTHLEPLKLLELLKAVELRLGREKLHKQCSPRPIDLDILIYDRLTLTLPNLVIPHPHLLERDFVILPLLEITGKSFYLYRRLKIALEKLRGCNNLYVKKRLEAMSWSDFVRSLVRVRRE